MDWNIILNVLNSVYGYILVSIFILLVGFIMSKAIGKLVEHLLRGVEINRLLRKLGSDVAFDKALSQLSSYAVYVITIIILLQFLGIKNLVLIVLLILISVILLISLLAAAVMFLPNVFFGYLLKKKLKKGDFIIIGPINGTIINIRLSDVLIRSKKDVLSVPYSFIRQMSKS